ncbi:hypothetical protein B0H14DRAFT_2156280, partial [Mycena olivaceomarginata]
MKRIEDQDKKDKNLAYTALTWVVNAKRPLSILELQTALAIEPDSKALNEDNMVSMDIILSVCAGLVIIDKKVSVVRLVHYTAQKYLDDIQPQKFPNAQTQITRTLLTYLSF